MNFLFIYSGFLVIYLANQASTGEIRAVIQFLRHGARTSSFEPYDHSLDTMLSREFLTNVGMHSHYLVGAATRKKYSELVSNSYIDKSVRIISSAKERCLLSATSYSMGLFDLGTGLPLQSSNLDYSKAPTKHLQYDSTLSNEMALPFKYQPIPIESFSDKFNSKVFQGLSKCKGMKEHTKKVYKELRKKHETLFKPTFDLLTNNDYQAIKIFKNSKYTFQDGLKVCDFILTDAYNNVDSKATQEEIEHCFYLKSVNNYSRFTDKKILSWVLGSLGTFLIPFFEKITNNDTFTKLLAVVAHQRDLGALIFLLNPKITECLEEAYTDRFINMRPVRNPECILIIKFAASLNFEITTPQNGAHYIKVLFQNKEVPVCDTGVCELTEFIKMYKDNADENWFDLCDVPDSDRLRRPSKNLFISLCVTAAIAVIMLVVFLIILFTPGEQNEDAKNRRDIEQALQAPDKTLPDYQNMDA
jgi:hypothetical protein